MGDVAGEGGAWGIAVLAAYLRDKQDGQSLAAYLDDVVFADASLSTVEPDPGDVAGFDAFMERWTGALDVQRAAVEHLR